MCLFYLAFIAHIEFSPFVLLRCRLALLMMGLVNMVGCVNANFPSII